MRIGQRLMRHETMWVVGRGRGVHWEPNPHSGVVGGCICRAGNLLSEPSPSVTEPNLWMRKLWKSVEEGRFLKVPESSPQSTSSSEPILPVCKCRDIGFSQRLSPTRPVVGQRKLSGSDAAFSLMEFRVRTRSLSRHWDWLSRLGKVQEFWNVGAKVQWEKDLQGSMYFFSSVSPSLPLSSLEMALTEGALVRSHNPSLISLEFRLFFDEDIIAIIFPTVYIIIVLLRKEETL